MRVGFHTNLQYYLANPEPKVGAIQIFIGRPISFWPTEIKNPDKIKDKIQELDLKVYVHSPYVYSLNHRINSVDGANKLQRIMKGIGLEYMVVHCQGEHSVQDWIEFLHEITDPRMILLENMAKSTYKSLSELEEISNATGCGICIDTAHLSNSGDTTTLTDWSKVKLVHCNYADFEKGLKKDNHSSKSLISGDVDWVKENILSKVNCDLITEINSTSVDLNEEIKVIQKLIL